MKISSLFWALALSIGILSCSEPSDTESTAAEVVPRETVPVERKIKIFTWGEYICPTVAEKFTEKTGIAVEIVEFETGDEVIAEIHSEPGKYDIVTVDGTTLQQMSELSTLAEIDHSKLENWENVHPQFLDLNCDPENKYSVPFHYGHTVVAYRKDKVGDVQKSWKALFDPKWEGKVAMLDEYDEVLSVALMAAGKPANSEDPEEIENAVKFIVRQLEHSETKFGTFIDILDALESGEIWIAMNYNGDTAMRAEKNPNVDFFVPEEGPILWVDHLAIPRDSQDLDAAHQFIDFMLDGEISAESSNYFHLATPNLAAVPNLDERMVSDPRIYLPEDVLAKSVYLHTRGTRSAGVIAHAVRKISDAFRTGGTMLVKEGEAVVSEQLTEAVPR